ncbi:MAG: hypothetical protein ACRC8S_20350 [Fimbriiglobus sp.]
MRLFVSVCVGFLMLTASECFAQTPIVTASAMEMIFGPGPGNPLPPGGIGKTIAVDGTFSLATGQGGQTPDKITVERGTMANGVFTPAGASKTVTTFGGGANGNYTYSMNFMPTALPAGTHSVRVVLTYKTPGNFPGQRITRDTPPVHSTTTITP